MNPRTLPPLILTLKTDERTALLFNDLRRRHFPPERNFLGAHVTMFHALPGKFENEIGETLTALAGETKFLSLEFPHVRFLGKGVAIDLRNEELKVLREKLRCEWLENLTSQDKQKNYRPHITIQNKVEPETARALYEQISREWQPVSGVGEGFSLWRYLNGPWQLVREFPFVNPQ